MNKKGRTKQKPQRKSRGKKSAGDLPVKYLLHHLNSPISIFDYRKMKFIYVNSQFVQLTGIPAEECYQMDLEGFLKHVQSYDLLALQNELKNQLVVASKHLVNSKNKQLTYSMNCRFKQTEGGFSDIMAQCSVIEWDNNYPAVTLNLYTDLTPHKRDLKVVFTVNILNEVKNQWEKVISKEYLRTPNMLSERETGVMKLIALDYSAEQIAAQLHMKFYTVRSHWRNILGKTGCKTQRELKEKALREGWI